MLKNLIWTTISKIQLDFGQLIYVQLREKVWRINLKTLKKDMHKIIGFPKFNTEFFGKTLFISGEKSDYTHESHKPKIRRLFPNSSFIGIQNAGHWLHVEKPLEFKDITNKFLNEKEAV